MPRHVPRLALAGLALAACQPGRDDRRAPTDTEPTPVALPLDAPEGLAANLGEPVQLEARDLVIRAQGAEIRIPYLSGQLVPVGDLVDTEVPASFAVAIDALEVVIPEQTVQTAMSPGEKPPFRELVVRTEGDSLSLRGFGGPLGLPFTFRAEPRITANGALSLDLEQVHLLGIGVKGFIGAFQGPIEDAANHHGHLIEVDEDQLIVDPFPFAGPPAVHAEFTSFEVHEHELVARLGELGPAGEAAGEPGLTLSGGVLRAGDVVLFDPQLRLTAEAGGPLVIDPAQLDAQLERGFTRQAHDGALTVYLSPPDAP